MVESESMESDVGYEPMHDPSPFVSDLDAMVANLDNMDTACGISMSPREGRPTALVESHYEDITTSNLENEDNQVTDISYTNHQVPLPSYASSFASVDTRFPGFVSDSKLSETSVSDLSEPLLEVAVKEKSTKSGSKKKGKTRSVPKGQRTYVCTWCDKAAFRSCQGLRFHKTIRCPSRLTQLGKQYFKCDQCRKAFVTDKGLRHHLQEAHGVAQ